MKFGIYVRIKVFVIIGFIGRSRVTSGDMRGVRDERSYLYGCAARLVIRGRHFVTGGRYGPTKLLTVRSRVMTHPGTALVGGVSAGAMIRVRLPPDGDR
jgi:hypothetical protein